MLAFAHRGATDKAPENTMAGFQDAVDLGYRFLETDIQASRDGTAFVFHDDDLERLTGQSGKIADLGDLEIGRLRINGHHQIPKLSELFETFPDSMFNLDIKSWPAVEPMAKVISHSNMQRQVCIGAFSDARISAALRHLGPDTCHSIGISNSIRFYVAAQLGIKLRFTADCIQLPMRSYGVDLITQKTIDYAHKFGLKVHVWTINDALTIDRLIGMGVDGIMTDECDLLKSRLKAHDLWKPLGHAT